METNPMLCNPENGICEINYSADSNGETKITSAEKPVRITYFTDPICSSCWGIEPQLRKLKSEYGAAIEIDYRMGGLLRDWSYNSGGISKPADVAHHWDEVSQYYQMPIDGDVWLEDPLDSSYPPSIAFKAAQMQDEAKAVLFLRKIREMVFLEKKNITKWEHIETAARNAGLDPIQLKQDYDHKAKELFQADLELAGKMEVRGFPTLFVSDDKGNTEIVYGSKPYEVFENAVTKMYPTIEKATYDTHWENLFNKYQSLTTKEFAVLSNQTFMASEEQLQTLFNQDKISKFVTKNGMLWKVKGSK